MKHNYISISIAAIALLVMINAIASAQSPTISYQGVLDNNGSLVNGEDTMKIFIYESATGGNALYSETQDVNIANGLFNISIGSVTPLLPALDFRKQYYIAVSVNGGAESSPRSMVSFAPYAFRAMLADTAMYASRATTATVVAGGVVNSIDGFNGALTVAGTNGITVANSVGNLTIGSTGVQSLNGLGGILLLAGAGGTTITHTGSTITIASTTSSGGGGGIVGLLNTDNTMSIKNPNGPTDTIGMASQGANAGQVLEWNGSAWRPATLSPGSGLADSINDLADARSFDNNVFLGSNCGVKDSVSFTVGTDNTAIGVQAMNFNTTGYQNTACGRYALYANTTGESNSAFGSRALCITTTGSGNTAVGDYALGDDTTGSENVAVGHLVMDGNGTGSRNVALGGSALIGNQSGNENTACGYWSLGSNLTGHSNVGLGAYVLWNNISGNYNTAIGDSAGPATSGLSNTSTLGNGAQATASNSVVLGNAAVTSLYCQGAYAATTANAANLVVAANGQIMRSTSSARYKTNIHDLDINTDRLYDLRPVSYTSKIDGKEYFGLVAEDVAKVLPELAEYARAKDVILGSTSDAMIPDAVKYPMLSVLLLDELKKEHAKVETQEKIIADLERRMEAVEASQKTEHH